MRINFPSMAVFAVLLLGAGPASATPLGLSMADQPDIVSAFIDVTYDAGSDLLTASGFALQLDVGISPDPIAGGLFNLSATIDDGGTLLGGTVSIIGTIAGLGFNSGTLLTGTLTALGFPDAGGDPLEFLFDVTGGDAAGLYGDIGGIILSSSGFTNWAADFDNLISGIPGTGGGLADTAGLPVSEPGILLLQALGLTLLLLARRRRN